MKNCPSSVLAAGIIAAMSLPSVAGAANRTPNGTCTPPGSWSLATDFPTTVVRSLGMFFPANGQFYVLGGRETDTAGSDFQTVTAYDPTADAWSATALTFPDNQVNNMVGGVLDVGGTPSIVVVGGSAAGATTASAAVNVIDPVAGTVTTLASDPWPGDADTITLPGGAAVLDNKLYVFGGFQISTAMLNTIWQFDPDAADGTRWTEMTATLPQGLGYIPMAASGGFIYSFGGSIWDGTTIDDTDTSFLYSPSADEIQSVATIPRVVAETRAVTETDGSIWVLGGGRTSPNPSNEVDVYDPTSDVWSLGPAMNAARRNFAADVDPATGKIFATGGYDVDGTTPLSVNEVFTPCTGPDDIIFADGFDPPI